MDVFDLLTMIGGLCLFLFGMNVMGEALERRAGSSLKVLLGKLTTKKTAGFLTGLGVTAVIQSSSATTVMVVGFVNSGLMALNQAINVIMGANVGTTVTAWILSLGGISGDAWYIQIFKPTSFTPILALVGIGLQMFGKKAKSKDTGMILLGFATLMFGMDIMSSAVSGLKNVPAFQNLFLLFKNPALGVLAGAVLTAIIQSSSASVGILQALSVTGQVSFGAAIPIIMGQNIGTCITAILSSIGANKNAKRAAFVHLSFNVIGAAVCLIIFYIIKILLAPAILDASATTFGIAICHSIFNIFCTVILLPFSKGLEFLANKFIPDSKRPEVIEELDERLLTTPAVAIERSRNVAIDMAKSAMNGIKTAVSALENYTPEMAETVRFEEETTDHYEDILGSYLLKLSSMQIDENDSAESAMLLKVIGDFERISDHGVNILESAEELKQKDLGFSSAAKRELKVLNDAVMEIVDLSFAAFENNDCDAIYSVESLEQIIDSLKEKLRSSHISRLQQGSCTVDVGFVWSDLLTNLERVSDHCSNIVGGLVDMHNHDMNTHEHTREVNFEDEKFKESFAKYKAKYSI